MNPEAPVTKQFIDLRSGIATRVPGLCYASRALIQVFSIGSKTDSSKLAGFFYAFCTNQASGQTLTWRNGLETIYAPYAG
jgi:hypothetical protein